MIAKFGHICEISGIISLKSLYPRSRDLWDAMQPWAKDVDTVVRNWQVPSAAA
jgi:hypothetical protein